MNAETIDKAIRVVTIKLGTAKCVNDKRRIDLYQRQLRSLNLQKSNLAQMQLLAAPARQTTPPRGETRESSYASLIEAANEGYWFCNQCERVCDVNPDKRTCEHCNSMRVDFHHGLSYERLGA